MSNSKKAKVKRQPRIQIVKTREEVTRMLSDWTPPTVFTEEEQKFVKDLFTPWTKTKEKERK